MIASGSLLVKAEAMVGIMVEITVEIMVDKVMVVIRMRGSKVGAPLRIQVTGLLSPTPLLLVHPNQQVAQTLVPAKKVAIILDTAIASHNPYLSTDLMQC